MVISLLAVLAVISYVSSREVTPRCTSNTTNCHEDLHVITDNPILPANYSNEADRVITGCKSIVNF